MDEREEHLLVEDVHKIKNEVASMKIQMGEIASMKTQVNDIYFAIKGSLLTGDGGLVARINEAEKDIILCSETTKLAMVAIDKRLAEIEKKESNQNIKIAIMWSALGGFVVLLFKVFFDKL